MLAGRHELKTAFERRTGGEWAINIGQVYTTLQRLERDGLVEPTGDAGERRDYRITPAGRSQLDDWYATPVVAEGPPRDELIIKVLLAVAAADVDVTDTLPLESPKLWALHVPDYVLTGPRRALATLRHALDDDIAAKLPYIAAPTLVVRGGRDPIISHHWPRRMAQALPRGRWAEIPGAPHCVDFSTPTELVGLIERYLALEGLVPASVGGPGRRSCHLAAW